MTTVLYVLLPIVLVGVLVSLVVGLKSLAGDKEVDRWRSNRMMQWRVGLQGLAVLIMLGIVALAS